MAVNWLGTPRDIPNGSTLESPSGPGGFNNDPATPYSRNAYHWSYLNSGSVQDIGTAEAWTLLDRVRRLRNKVRLGIVDQGFAPTLNGDLPLPLTVTSVLPFVDPEREGFGGFGWHGTAVASAAAAVPDNRVGEPGQPAPSPPSTSSSRTRISSR